MSRVTYNGSGWHSHLGVPARSVARNQNKPMKHQVGCDRWGGTGPKPNRLTLAAAEYSALVVIGAVMALVLLSGCATANMGGSSDQQYQFSTGYPAVGGRPMH